jgi:GNAT superfamily N-acetyltransferase
VVIVQRRPWTALQRGDIILYHRDRRFIAHRILRPPKNLEDACLCKGDTLKGADPPVHFHQYLGRVEGVERGKKVIFFTHFPWSIFCRVFALLSYPYAQLFWFLVKARRWILRVLLPFRVFRVLRRRLLVPSVVLQSFQPEDLDKLTNCLWDRAWYLRFSAMREKVRQWVEEVVRQGGIYLVAWEGRKIIGCISAFPSEGGFWRIADFYVHPIRRGLLVGTRLLSEMKARVWKEGGQGLRCCAKDRALQKLLSQQGFHPQEGGLGEDWWCFLGEGL